MGDGSRGHALVEGERGVTVLAQWRRRRRKRTEFAEASKNAEPEAEDGGFHTYHVVLQGDRGVRGHRTCPQVCQYNDSLNIPHSTLTDHYYRLPSFVSV